MRILPEAARIAQHIVERDFLALYRAIKRSKCPKVATAQALTSISQARLVGLIIRLLEEWYLQKRQLDSTNELLDVGE
jgi:hypothetical protein